MPSYLFQNGCNAQVKGRERKTISFIHFFGTHCTPHTLFLCIIFNVSQSIFEFFINHHDFLKTNKIVVLDNKSQTKKALLKSRSSETWNNTMTLLWNMIRSPSCFYVVFSTKYLIICQHRSHQFLKEFPWYATDKNIRSVKCNMGKELSN